MQPLPPFPSVDTLLQQADRFSGASLLLAISLAVIIVVAARDWRLVLAALLIVYIGLAIVTASLLPGQWALLRVVVGGLAAVIWYLSAQQAGWGGRFLPFQHSLGVQARPLSSTTLFRTLVALFLGALLLVLRPRLPLPVLPDDVRYVIIWLGAFGLLGLALGDEALQVGVALLLWLAAAQLMLAALQDEAWLIWLLSSVELLLALATGYLMVARGRLWSHEPEGGE
jgi:hypothetical protein